LKAWNLGNCNDLSVVLFVDKKGTLRYLHKGKLSEAERNQALTLLRSIIDEAKGS
jgi:predicted transcriptional regulator